MAPFVIFEDFESILEPLKRQVKQTTYSHQHKVCAEEAILCSTIRNYNQLAVLKIEKMRLLSF